jgi:Tfp pilus assembly protein PilN
VIQVNLLPKEERIAEPRFNFRTPRARVWIPALIGVAVLLPIGGMYATQRARITSLRADIDQASLEMRRLQPQIDRIEKLVAEREELNLRLSVIQGLCRERYVAVEVMDHLADQVPDHLWLTKMSLSGPGQISLEGMTLSNLMVAELMSRMERSEVFQDVALTVAERVKSSSKEQPVLAFTLMAKVKP